MSPTALLPASPGQLRDDDLVAAGPRRRAPVRETEMVHDAAGCHVLRLVDADDAVEAADGEPELERRASPLGRQTPPAPRTREAPPHLDGRKDLGQEVRHSQTGPPDHGPALPIDHRLEPE